MRLVFHHKFIWNTQNANSYASVPFIFKRVFEADVTNFFQFLSTYHIFYIHYKLASLAALSFLLNSKAIASKSKRLRENTLLFYNFSKLAIELILVRCVCLNVICLLFDAYNAYEQKRYLMNILLLKVT